MKRFVLFILLVTFPAFAWAGTYQLQPDVKLVFPDLPSPWQVTTEPSSDLVAHLAEHVKEEAEQKGVDLTDERALELARERLEREELFLVNPQSHANILVSVAGLDSGQSAPDQETINLSAEYAVEGTADEGWQIIEAEHKEAAISGADHAARFIVDYKHEGKRNRFIGVVGFAQKYWFWLYFKDHLKDPADVQTFESFIEQVDIQVSP